MKQTTALQTCVSAILNCSFTIKCVRAAKFHFFFFVSMYFNFKRTVVWCKWPLEYNIFGFSPDFLWLVAVCAVCMQRFSLFVASDCCCHWCLLLVRMVLLLSDRCQSAVVHRSETNLISTWKINSNFGAEHRVKQSLKRGKKRIVNLLFCRGTLIQKVSVCVVHSNIPYMPCRCFNFNMRVYLSEWATPNHSSIRVFAGKRIDIVNVLMVLLNCSKFNMPSRCGLAR